MSQHGKKFRNAVAKVERGKRYPIDEACKLIPETKVAKFDESVDIAVRLGVDPKHADQMVRGAVVLPHGTGKSQRVIVVAKGDKANEARAAGADAVGAEDLVEKIQKENWTEFDSMVATPDMMGLVGRLGRVLGPKGLMPNPKVGTVTNDVGQGRARAQGRPRGVPRREGRDRSGPHRQGVVRRREAERQRPRHDRHAAAAQAGRRPRGRT